MRTGIHLSISGGFQKTLQLAEELQCTTLQVFVRNPRSWKAGTFDKEGAIFAKEQSPQKGINPWVVHVSYLINPCSPDKDIYEKSLHALEIEVSRAILLGAEFFVMHPGNHKNTTVPRSIWRLQKTLDYLMNKFPDIVFLLENTAGSGTSLGGSFNELAQAINMFPQENVCLCFDTCHALAGGYDIRSSHGWSTTLKEIDNEMDTKRLKLLHVNDSLAPLGSGIDRHTHLGEGHIGQSGFKAMLEEPLLRNLPMILETPGDPKVEGSRNLNFLRNLQG